MSCPHCDSADVRPSHTSFGFDRIGLHRYRCRACGGRFWLRRGRIEAVRARRRDYLEAPAGAAPAGPRAAAPAILLGGLDGSPDAPGLAADLQALDLELQALDPELQALDTRRR
jgi:hypothetical protein